MDLLKEGSIKQKLIKIALLVSCFCCLLCGALLTVKEVILQHKLLIRRIDVDARIIGMNSIAALTFHDQKAAQEILSALRSAQNIVCAVLYDDSGAVFANYRRDASVKDCRPRLIVPDVPNFDMHHTGILKSVKLDNDVIGSLYIESDLREVYTHILWYVLTDFAAMILAVITAILLVSRLQRVITGPLVDMAGVTRTISKRKDYSLRMVVQNKDEAGILAEGFNEMLSQIQKRDTQLDYHREHLQELVVERTQALEIANTTLQQQLADRKRIEEERLTLIERLNRAEKMEALGQLAGGIAHDLNNVLGVLSGYSELLLLEIPEGNRSRDRVEQILQSTAKGAAIIQDMLTLARRGVMASDVINLYSVVSGFLKTPAFERLKDHHPLVTFRTEFDKDLLNIKGSSIHMEKTVMNLITNAVEAISGSGEVVIRLENRYLDKTGSGYDEVRHGDYVVLTVSDTGMGIPAENIEKIFEPFYTKKTMGRSGTGLGLAIVWGTVKDHHGYIDVQSDVEEGTTFTLYFPVTRENLITQQEKVPIERYMGKGESVLVVDDIAEQRDVAEGLLTRLGYKVHLVSSGEAAVEYLKGNKADILVLDMIMAPGIDGLETYKRVLQINQQQKVIIVSGFSETDRVKEAQKLGRGAYVKKPYVMEKIGMAIREELNR